MAPAAAAIYAGLLAPLGFAILLGVVLCDMVVDFSGETGEASCIIWSSSSSMD